MTRSRRTYKLEKETKRNIYYIIAGVVLLIIVIMTFGSSLLVNLSLFVERDQQPGTSSDAKTAVVAQPFLDPIPRATNSAVLTIKGTAYSGEKVQLYLNGKSITTKNIQQDGTFEFLDIELDNGENMLKAKAITQDKAESKFSSTATVLYSTETPELEISSPQDGESVNKERNPFPITGKTSPDATVTVNGFRATIDDQGNFSYRLSLRGGDNFITVTATTKAGNKTEKIVKISYSE